jgi:hypothetical protein
MSVVMVRQKVRDGSLEAAEAGVRELFATLDRVRPEGLRYASTRVADGSTFVILFELADGIEDPRPGSPSTCASRSSSRAGWKDRRWSSASTSSARTSCSDPDARNPAFDSSRESGQGPAPRWCMGPRPA